MATSLAFDPRLVASTERARLAVGSVAKDPANPLMREDRPWEPRWDNVYVCLAAVACFFVSACAAGLLPADGALTAASAVTRYANVIYDDEDALYKCWYNPMIIEERTSSVPEELRNPTAHPDYMAITPTDREMALCYATSVDGHRWVKPELGLVEFQGSTANNIVKRHVGGACVFKDRREPDPSRRYKLFYSPGSGGGESPDPDRPGKTLMTVAFSGDGARWGASIALPQVPASGTHPCAFWDERQQKYVAFTRKHEGGANRVVSRTESPDFVNWSRDEVVLRGASPRLQIHDMMVFPTHGMYLAFLGIMVYPDAEPFNNWGETRPDSSEPPCRRFTRVHSFRCTGDGCLLSRAGPGVKQHVELAWSPDSEHWQRISEGTPLIPQTPAPARFGEVPYDWGCIFPSLPIIPEPDSPVEIFYGAVRPML